MRQVRDAVEAEDIVQEAFVCAFTRLDQLQDPDRLAAWLGAIADNLVRTWYRRRYVQQRWLEAESGEVAALGQARAEDPPVWKAALRRALGELSRSHRQVVVYHYLKGYSYAATARQLDIGVDTVRSRLQKARRRLKEELDNMADDASMEQVFTLNESDLQALGRARAFVGDDPKQLVLQGVFLDAGGRIVATDGSRLFWWQTSGLESLAAPVLLGPWDESTSEAGGARLTLGEQEAVLELESGAHHILPIMDMPYVDYEKVVPGQMPCWIRVRAGDLLAACAYMDDHLEAWHPVAADGPWTYTRGVEVCFSAADRTMVMTTTDAMGYYSLKESVEGPTERPRSPVGWRFDTTIAAQVEQEVENFRVRVNCSFLEGAVRGLGLEEGSVLCIGFSDPNKPVLFEPGDGRPYRTMVMPMRMEAAA